MHAANKKIGFEKFYMWYLHSWENFYLLLVYDGGSITAYFLETKNVLNVGHFLDPKNIPIASMVHKQEAS